jgi:hypothetical protein
VVAKTKPGNLSHQALGKPDGRPRKSSSITSMVTSVTNRRGANADVVAPLADLGVAFCTCREEIGLSSCGNSVWPKSL